MNEEITKPDNEIPSEQATVAEMLSTFLEEQALRDDRLIRMLSEVINQQMIDTQELKEVRAIATEALHVAKAAQIAVDNLRRNNG